MAAQKLWLAIDPGETTGFSLWRGKDLVWGDQLPMWKFADAVYSWAKDGDVPAALDFDGKAEGSLGAMVIEQWQLYPWMLEKLAWDHCRTARLIGALEFTARQHGIKCVFQGADIKEGAIQAGAEALFLEPVHENRHCNDSLMHGCFYLAKHGKPPA